MKTIFFIFSVLCNFLFQPKDASQDLLKACKTDNLEQVKLALKAGADVNVKDSEGNSALIWACAPKDSKEKREIKKLLIEAGADVNAKDASYGMTVLTWVFAAKDFATIELLLQHKVDVKGTNKDGGNLLAFALQQSAEEFKECIGTLELLADKGLEMNPEFITGDKIFTEAAKKDKIDLVKFLLAHGVNVNTTDKEGSTALMRACYNANVALVKLLVENKADINEKTKGGWMSGSTALMEAMEKNNVEIVKLLIDKGADVNIKTNEGRTALMRIQSAVNSEETATLLIAKGADVNTKAANGWTALHTAAINGNLGLVKLLLSKGAVAKAKDENLQTPLDYAKTANKTEVVKLLSKY